MNTQAETLQICREITNFRDFNPKSPGIYISFLKDSITEVLLSQGNITAIIKSFNTYINVNSWFHNSPLRTHASNKIHLRNTLRN